MAISLFSFFSGAGLLDLGFEAEQYNIVFVNEYERSFLDAYIYARQQHYPLLREPRYGYHQADIRQYLHGEQQDKLFNHIKREKRYHNIVGFIGGPPCPDFSIAGKNLGKDGRNGVLSLSYVNLIIQCHPDFFVFENVKGLVKTEKHRKHFRYLKRKLRQAGYITSDRILNSLCYGVPQDRDRIILIGFKRDSFANIAGIINARGMLAFPWGENAVFPNLNTVKGQNWPTRCGFNPGQRMYAPRNLPREYRCLAVETWFRKNDVINHPNAADIFRVKAGRAKIDTIQEGDVSGKSFKRLHRWRYSPTAAYGNNEVHLHPYAARRISVAEAMAVQSLPAWFSLPPRMPLTQKFKVIGNGVPYLMSRAIAKTLKATIDGIR